MSADLYEHALAQLYVRLAAIVADHAPHFDGIPGLAAECPTTERCDALGLQLYDAIDATFPSDDAERWLVTGPDDLLDWEVVTQYGHSPRDAIVEALRSHAVVRLFPDYSVRPVDPATTRPVPA